MIELQTPFDLASAYLPVTVQAWMYFPNDRQFREAYARRYIYRMDVDELGDDDSVVLSAAALRKLIADPSTYEIEDLKLKALKEGMIAGYMLNGLYHMSRFDLGHEPSLRKVIYSIQKYALKTTFGDDSVIPRSEKSIKDIWTNHLRVAHLWAAYQLNHVYRFSGENPFSSKEGLTKLLAAATTFHRFGSEFIPSHSHDKKPLLATRQLTPNSLEELDFNFLVEPLYLADLLTGYKAPPSQR